MDIFCNVLLEISDLAILVPMEIFFWIPIFDTTSESQVSVLKVRFVFRKSGLCWKSQVCVQRIRIVFRKTGLCSESQIFVWKVRFVFIKSGLLSKYDVSVQKVSSSFRYSDLWSERKCDRSSSGLKKNMSVASRNEGSSSVYVMVKLTRTNLRNFDSVCTCHTVDPCLANEFLNSIKSSHPILT